MLLASDVLHQVGDCKCKNNRITKRNRKVKCRSVAGGSGSLTLTATFMDIAFGDGSNGVDVSSGMHRLMPIDPSVLLTVYATHS